MSMQARTTRRQTLSLVAQKPNYKFKERSERALAFSAENWTSELGAGRLPNDKVRREAEEIISRLESTFGPARIVVC